MTDPDNADWRSRYDELAKCQTERAQAMADRDNYLQHMRWTFNVLDDGDSNAPLVELARRMKKGRAAERDSAALWTARAAERGLQVEAMAGLLTESRRQHFHVEEDCYFCCPACEDYCGDKKRNGVKVTECTCGADKWNARVDAMVAGWGKQVAPATEKDKS